MHLTAHAALWFAPFVWPICVYIAYTDLRDMRIPNGAVLALVAVFALIGLFALPLPDYGWRWVHLAVVLVLGILFNAAGAMGAGDAKFIAAAAPLIAPGDFRLLLMIFAANLLAAFATHRLAKHTPLRRIAPHWQSWDMGAKFPMGLALGGTLGLYLALGLRFGA